MEKTFNSNLPNIESDMKKEILLLSVLYDSSYLFIICLICIYIFTLFVIFLHFYSTIFYIFVASLVYFNKFNLSYCGLHFSNKKLHTNIAFEYIIKSIELKYTQNIT